MNERSTMLAATFALVFSVPCACAEQPTTIAAEAGAEAHVEASVAPRPSGYEAVKGLRHCSPENRAKSASLLCSTARCSIA